MKQFRHHALCLICLLMALPAVAQNRTINLSAKNEPVRKVLRQIELQSGYTFFYSDKTVDVERRVTIEAVNRDVVAVVNEIFDGYGITCSIIDRNIVLTDDDRSGTGTGKADSQTSRPKYAGRVVDEKGQPVVGATVLSTTDPTKATSTGLDGSFSLNVPEGDLLQISFVGYATSKIKAVNDGQEHVVVLKEDFQQLDEVIVVGYGTQRRSDVTGSIASVSAEKLNIMPTTNVGEMLRGAAAGVQVSLDNAAPGGSSTVLIRGRRSLSADNTPLYIVDGVPMSSIDDINSNDIASLEILKDASSQSIYGARAANGVILITTKRGLSGKPRISYSGYAAVQDIHRNFEFYNGPEWAAYRKEAYIQAYGIYDEESCFGGLMKEVLDSGEWVDWEKLMISKAFQQKHDVLVQAGNDKTKYAFGIGLYTQDGMVLNSGFKKLSGRLNIDQKITRTLSMGANLSYSRAWKETADGSFNLFVTMPPLAKVYEDDGVTLRKDVTEAGESHYNPLWNINHAENRSKTDRYIINLFADWKICKDLSYRLNTSMNARNVDSSSYLGLEHTTGESTQGKATSTTSAYFDYLLENIFNYAKELGSGHRLDATLMQSINVITWKSLGVNGTGFANDDLSYNAIGSALEYGVPSYQLSERRMVSFLGRIRYNYRDRYLFTAALRVDGSSVFGRNNKFGYFPSASFAWRASEEAFLKEVDWLSNLKLRLSWGQVGNQGVSPYTTLGLTDKYMTEFGSTTAVGYLPNTTLSNPNLKWETSTSTNVGLDFGFFDGRLSGSLEFYNTLTSDLLIYKSLSQSTGYVNQLVNLGKVRNRGIEATIHSTPLKIKDFQWNVDITYAKNDNRIIQIDGSLDENGNPANDVNNKWFIGQPMNVYYDYVFDGIWQIGDDISGSHMPDAEPGSIRIKDTDGDQVITDNDRIIMKRDPDWVGSVSTSFLYKGFDLSAELYLSMGGTMYNPYLTSFTQGGDMTGKRNGIRRNYWTVNNPSNEAPAPNMTQAPAYISSLGYQDASYVRLRNVQFGYTFPKKIANRIAMQQLRLYVTFTNLWTDTEVLGYGPEQTPGDYPEPRTMLFGVNITF